MHGNAGWSFAGGGSDYFIFRAAGDYTFAKGWHAVLEWDTGTMLGRTFRTPHSGLLAGLRWQWKPYLTWDAAARTGFSSDDEDFLLTAGLTLGF